MQLIVLLVTILLAGCSNAPAAPCGFRLTANEQRISWGVNVPEVLSIDNSVPVEYHGAIRAAALSWNRAAGREIIAIGESANTISYTKDWQTNSNSQAITKTKYSGTRIVSTLIQINGNYDKLDVESLMLHELGHSLGLAHSDIGVMSPYLADNEIRRTLSRDDVNNIKCEY